jgi:hypothetical protein
MGSLREMNIGRVRWLVLALFQQLAVQAASPVDGGSSGSEAEVVLVQARAFFVSLLASDAAALVDQSEFPFHLEGRKIAAAEQLKQEWAKNFANKRIDLLTLYGIEILTPAQMENKYGRPPARLASLPWQTPGTYLAVANLSGRAAIAIFHRSALGWRAVAYTD